MKIITVKPLKSSTTSAIIPLGKQGENEATKIKFDVANFITDFGNDGTFVLLCRRPGDRNPYPVATMLEGTDLVWIVSSADLSREGCGECELQYLIGDVVVKSRIWPTRVLPALKEPGEAPPAETGWVVQLLANIQEMIATGLYCGFDLDPKTGILYMVTADGYGGLAFDLSDDGYLEVII